MYYIIVRSYSELETNPCECVCIVYVKGIIMAEKNNLERNSRRVHEGPQVFPLYNIEITCVQASGFLNLWATENPREYGLSNVPKKKKKNQLFQG